MKKNLSIILSGALGLMATGSPLNKDAGNLKALANKSILFTENKGQVHDQHFKPNNAVLFSGKANELTFHLKNDGISYQLYKVNEKTIAVSRLDISWLNINENHAVLKGKAQEGFSNYLNGNTSVCNVQSYSDVTYTGIYNGIDLRWYDANGTLEYDFIVHPGADYKQIQMKVQGAEGIKINSNGDLEMSTPFGKVVEKAPLVKQNGNILVSKWNVKKNEVSFIVENYNPNQAMIIDPVVRTWGTYYGGSGTDIAYVSKVDGQGNLYMAGHTTSGTSTLIATVGSYQTTFAGVQDAFLVKFNSSGTRLWATYYGGTAEEQGLGLGVDNAGNVYLSGRTVSTNTAGISTVGAHQTAHGGGTYDGYLVKFNSSGVRQWGTYYGGTGDEELNTIAVTSAGDVYVSGMGSSTGTTLATPGSHQPVVGGGRDAFLVKFNSSGVRQWGTYYGGTVDDRGYSCDVDANGNVFLVGDTQSNTGTVIATAAAQQTVQGGGYDAFIVKFNPSGVRQWGTYYGGTGSEYEPVCRVDYSGNIYLNGYTNSNTGTVIATPGTYGPTFFGGANDSYLVKFDNNGVRQWGTYHGSSTDADYVNKTFDIDPAGNVYFGGYTLSNGINGYATAGSQQTVHGGATEGFVVSFTPSGQKGWGTYYGGTGNDLVHSVNYYNGVIYAAGETSSNTGTVIATAVSSQSVYGGGGSDGFLVQFNPTRAEALAFDGASDYVNIGTALNSTLATLNKITVEAWAKPTSLSGLGNIISNYGTGAGSSLQFLLRRGNSGFEFFVGDGTPGPGGWASVTSVAVPTLNVWQHVAGTWNGTVMSIYVNGALSATSTCTFSAMGTQTNAVWIGGNTISEYFTGHMDEIRIWNRALCQGEILNNKNAEIATTAPGLLANYHFNQGFASESNPGLTSLNEFSGSNLTGTLTTFALTGGTSNWVSPGAVKSDSSGTAFVTPTISVNSGSFCAGSSFTMSPSGASTYTFQGGNAVVSPTSNTSYTVIGTTSLGCITNTTSSSVSVTLLPTVTAVSSETNTLCQGQSATLTAGGATSYTWNPGATTGTTTVISPTATSSYTVIGADASGCVNTASITQNVTDCTGLKEQSARLSSMSVYPNPSTGVFAVEIQSSASMKVADAIGRVVFNGRLNAGSNKIDLSAFPSGVYTLKVEQADQLRVIKLIKE